MSLSLTSCKSSFHKLFRHLQNCDNHNIKPVLQPTKLPVFTTITHPCQKSVSVFFSKKKGKTCVLPTRIASQFSLVSHYITSISLYIKRWTILVLDSPSFLHFLIDVFYFVSVFSVFSDIFPYFYRQAADIFFIISFT